MAVKLAGQGLNIILVALPDSHLQETYAFLSKSYPGIACRAVSAWLPCMTIITAVVQLSFHVQVGWCGLGEARVPGTGI